MTRKTPLILLSLTALLQVSPLLAQGPDCGSEGLRTETHEASASVWANLVERSDSLSVVAARVVSSKLSEILPEEQRLLKIKIEPQKTLKGYSEQASCNSLLKQSKLKPFEVTNKKFNSTKKLTNWISEFSQGENSEGKRLYKECPGRCSPRYTYLIEKKDSLLLLEAKVLCGHARDKANNLYKITASICQGLSSQQKTNPKATKP